MTIFEIGISQTFDKSIAVKIAIHDKEKLTI